MAERNKFKQDYEVAEIKKQGRRKMKYEKKLIYKGSYYTIKGDKMRITHLKWIFFILTCLIAVIFLGVGSLNNEGSRKIYIILPYVFMFLPIFYSFMGTLKLLHVNAKMTRVEFEHTVERIKKSSLSLVIIAIAAMIGQIIFLIHNHVTSAKSLDYVFLGGIMVIGCLALVLLQLQKRYEVEEEPSV